MSSAGRGEDTGAPAGPRGRRRLDLDKPGLGEALTAYTALLDEIVPASQYCKGSAESDPEKLRVYGDIIERAAARARERDRSGAVSDTSQGEGR